MSWHTRNVKRVRVTIEKENPGEITVLDAEAKPCEPYTVTETKMRRNPNKVNDLVLKQHFVRLNVWHYRDNPTLLGIAINQEYCFLNPTDQKLLYLALREALSRAKQDREG